MHGKALTDAPAHGNRLYNSKEARALLGGISERTFRKLTATNGPLKIRRQGARVYVSQSAIDEYIAALPTTAEEPTVDAQSAA